MVFFCSLLRNTLLGTPEEKSGILRGLLYLPTYFYYLCKKKKMIFFSKDMQSKVKTKTVTKEELSKYLLTNLTVFEIADELSDYILKETPEAQPIAVTEEEFERICSMFRVKGKRMVDGCYVAETRGRRPVTNKND